MPNQVTEAVVRSSGNVFADLGLPDAAELDTKARLCAAINRIVERKRLSQADTATALGINQPKVSALLHYKLEGFSVERLMNFLLALGQDVEIVVKAKPRSRSARIDVKGSVGLPMIRPAPRHSPQGNRNPSSSVIIGRILPVRSVGS